MNRRLGVLFNRTVKRNARVESTKNPIELEIVRGEHVDSRCLRLNIERPIRDLLVMITSGIPVTDHRLPG